MCSGSLVDWLGGWEAPDSSLSVTFGNELGHSLGELVKQLNHVQVLTVFNAFGEHRSGEGEQARMPVAKGGIASVFVPVILPGLRIISRTAVCSNPLAVAGVGSRW